MADCCEEKKPDDCCNTPEGVHGWDCRYRQILWVILIINAAMFVIELGSGIYSGSQSLLADAIDFFGDAANYGISLYVLNKSLMIRAKASLLKGGTMALFGLWILGSTVYKALVSGIPQAEVMGAIGFLALIANITCAALLYKYRSGDSNRESVWICSRNDAIGNVAVMLAAVGVFATGTKWPDLLVAAIMAGLALSGGWRVIRSAFQEIQSKNGNQ
jgi:Co/Zn/Cd efflux system component